MIPLTDKRLLLQVLYPRWGIAAKPLKDGYSILLPLPSDLPLFYRIAMRVLSRQSLAHANEIIIIPDDPRPAFRDLVDQGRSLPLAPSVVLAESTGLKRAVARLYDRPNHYHWSQIVRGIGHSGSRYTLLHDADMFLLEEGFIERHYAEALRKNLKVLGISPAWDPWYAQNGFPHVTATWEMLASVEWFRSFPPILFHGHTNRIGGLTHTFDTTYYVQCLTDPRSVARRECGAAFIHFNWLISGYRWFVKSGKGSCDDRFIVLLLRLLADEFDPEHSYRHIPSWADLSACLSGEEGPLSYPSIKTHRESYRSMREKIGSLFGSSLVTPAGRDSFDRKIEAFDSHYGYEGRSLTL